MSLCAVVSLSCLLDHHLIPFVYSTGDTEPALMSKYLLQEPWQPAASSLTLDEYAAMETCTVKYQLYTEALTKAIRTHAVSTSPQTGIRKGEEMVQLTILVCGAGRGPLVRASLMAADRVQQEIMSLRLDMHVIAVEFNKVAYDYCVAQEWPSTVRFFNCTASAFTLDVATANGVPKFDIVVSELLGSFADNELAPEVLAATRALTKPGCIYIPQSHTSALYPITSESVRNILSTSHAENSSDPHQHPWNLAPWYESTREVRMLPGHGSAMSVLPAFTFNYPESLDKHTEQQSVIVAQGLSWTVSSIDPVDVDGLCGVFTAKLYDDVILCTFPLEVQGREPLGASRRSTVVSSPSPRTPGLTEWMPMLFPLQKRIHLRAGLHELRAEMRRVKVGTSTHYEWSLSHVSSENNAIQLHNAGGKHWRMSLNAANRS
jgi:protein arginine N-methyltransferase 5